MRLRNSRDFKTTAALGTKSSRRKVPACRLFVGHDIVAGAVKQFRRLARHAAKRRSGS